MIVVEADFPRRLSSKVGLAVEMNILGVYIVVFQESFLSVEFLKWSSIKKAYLKALFVRKVDHPNGRTSDVLAYLCICINLISTNPKTYSSESKL